LLAAAAHNIPIALKKEKIMPDQNQAIPLIHERQTQEGHSLLSIPERVTRLEVREDIISALTNKGATKDDITNLITNTDIRFVATNDKIESLGKELNGKIEATNGKIESLGKELNGKIEATNDKIESLGKELNGKIESLGKELNGKIESLGKEIAGKIESLGKEIAGKIQGLEGKLSGMKIVLYVLVPITIGLLLKLFLPG
jgi:predicted  nucleic acid-binding Zn-ribbon protein